MAESSDPNVRAIHALFESLHEHRVISHDCFQRSLERLTTLLTALRRHDLGDDEYWKLVRSQWAFASTTKIPMNAANLCPRPLALTEALGDLRVCFDENVSQQRRTDYFANLVLLAKQSIAKGLGCSPDDLAIVRNASEANNAINCGYRGWSDKAKVVLWKENHPTNNTAWKLRAEWSPGDVGVRPSRFTIVEIPSEPGTDWQAISAAFIAAIDENTRFVSFSETSNGNGWRIPRRAIQAIYQHVETRYPKCHVHVDGAMSWGAQDIALAGPGPNRLHCHSFSASAHKWFCGPKETGILFMDPRKVSQFQPSIFAYDYRILVPERWQDLPKTAQRFEMIGQRDDVGIIALYFAQLVHDAINGSTKRSVAKRVAQLGIYLKDKLVKDDWKLITPPGDQLGLAVVRVRAPRKSSSGKPKLYDWLYDERDIAGSGGGATPEAETFRLCPHIYNVEADIDRAVAGMNEWRRLP